MLGKIVLKAFESWSGHCLLLTRHWNNGHYLPILDDHKRFWIFTNNIDYIRKLGKAQLKLKEVKRIWKLKRR